MYTSVLFDGSHLRLCKTEWCGEIFAFLTDDVMVLAERLFQLQQLGRWERRPDALRLAERQQKSGGSVRTIHCVHNQKNWLIEIFYVPLDDTEYVISETFFPANLLA